MPIQMALRPKARICGAYPAIGYGRINVFGHSLFISPRFSIERICVILKKRKQDFITHTSEQTKPEHKKRPPQSKEPQEPMTSIKNLSDLI